MGRVVRGPGSYPARRGGTVQTAPGDSCTGAPGGRRAWTVREDIRERSDKDEREDQDEYN